MVARRKPGPKPRRVPQNSVPVPASPSPSLAQLFAAADSPQRPSSGSEESESASTTHHKDGRPRNLGRGVSKPKKNTVASLLAQSRALGIKPTPTLDPSVPLSHQVSLLRSNILAAQLHATATGQTGQTDDKNQVKFVVDIYAYILPCNFPSLHFHTCFSFFFIFFFFLFLVHSLLVHYQFYHENTSRSIRLIRKSNDGAATPSSEGKRREVKSWKGGGFFFFFFFAYDFPLKPCSLYSGLCRRR